MGTFKSGASLFSPLIQVVSIFFFSSTFVDSAKATVAEYLGGGESIGGLVELSIGEDVGLIICTT